MDFSRTKVDLSRPLSSYSKVRALISRWRRNNPRFVPKVERGAYLNVNSIVAAPIATGLACLSEEERDLGVALVEVAESLELRLLFVIRRARQLQLLERHEEPAEVLERDAYPVVFNAKLSMMVKYSPLKRNAATSGGVAHRIVS